MLWEGAEGAEARGRSWFRCFSRRARKGTRRTQRDWGGLLACGELLAFLWFDSFGRRGAFKLPVALCELYETLRLCDRKVHAKSYSLV